MPRGRPKSQVKQKHPLEAGETVPERSDRELSIAAYAGEVRAVHMFFGASLIAIAAFHLLVVLPFHQVRAAIPVIAGGMAEAEQQIKSADEAQKAAAAAVGVVAQFRRAMTAGPEQLRSAIADLVARGRVAAGPRGDPYKAIVRVPREGGRATPGSSQDENVTVEETIRRQIGKQTEALILSLEAALEPLRSLKHVPPETEEILRTTRETIGGEVLALNEILREAFAAEPNFWLRWQRQGSTFGAASARAEGATRRIEGALGLLNQRLDAASTVSKNRQQELGARVEALRAKQADLRKRLEGFSARLGWIPLGLEESARLYPIVAGAVTLTVLLRLRRILALRRALAGVDLDVVAPSWVVGSPSSPGRWWALSLIAVPLVATIHGAVAALMDRGLFVTVLGDPSQTMLIGYATAYAVLILAGVIQLLAVTRGLMVPQKRPAYEEG